MVSCFKAFLGQEALISKCLSPPRWVLANLLLGVTLRWTSIPSRGGIEILLVASCYRKRDKLRPDGPHGTYEDLTSRASGIIKGGGLGNFVGHFLTLRLRMIFLGEQ